MIDADQYRRLLMSNKYKKENKEIRVQLATLARLLNILILMLLKHLQCVDSYHSTKILECAYKHR